MTGQELYEHVQQLAEDLDVPTWVCLGCAKDADRDLDYWYVYGEAVKYGSGERLVVMTEMPDEPIPYLIALHELGHHADPQAFRGLRLDREAYAWRWALEQSLIPPGPAEWRRIWLSLSNYATGDRRMKRTPNFESLLAEAERNAA